MSCKKILACVTSLLICCGALDTPQVADLVSSSILVHADDSGSCGENATYSFDSSTGTLTISGTGVVKENNFFNSDALPWNEYMQDIKVVNIEDGITNISAAEFYYCTSLTDITIPNSVTIIGEASFAGCESLTNISIPSSITSIGHGAFDDCTSLTDIYYSGTEEEWDSISIDTNFNESLTDATIHYESMGSCGDNATWLFDETTGTLTISGTGAMKDYSYSGNTPWYLFKDLIKTVIINNGITSVGNFAFNKCTSLISINIPNSVTSIGSNAFWNCKLLNNLTIPNGVTSIGDCAFWGCTSLSSINISNSVAIIGSCTFYNCTSLEDVYFNGTKEDWDNINIDLYNDSLTNANIYCSNAGPCGDKSKWYFDNTTGTLTISGTGAMKDYSSIDVPWYSCVSLIKNVIINDGITSIGKYTFYNCKSLSSITIPSSITSIGNTVFYNCTSLTDVYYNGSRKEWNKIDISSSGNTYLTNATIHYANQDNTMVFGEDNWNFTNSNMYFGMSGSKTYINPKDKYTLLRSLSNTERVRMIKYLDGTWQGSCYGMSVTELLAKVGIFDVNAWDSSADTLNELSVLDPEENSAEESLINYYQLLQVTDLIQQEISNTITNRKDYDVVAELLDMVSEVKNGGTPVLVCYSGNGFAHAVVAYGVEDDYKVINGVKYNKKILVMDSNFGNQFNSDACIYVNSDSNRWCIPYSEYNLSSDDEYTRIILATNDLELINNKGYFETPEEYLSDNQYISVLEFNYNTNFNICKTIESGNGNWINSTQNGVPEGELFYGFFANDTTNTATAKTTLKDSLSGYSYSIDNPDEMNLNMSYKNCYLTINADNSYNVKFAPKGYISMEGENSSYSMNMVFNDGYYTLPWSNIQVDGKNVNNVSMDKTDGGIVISSDNLTNVKVSAISYDVFTKVTFSTEYDKALVYAIDDYTIGIKVDKDSNGTFETVLTQSKSYNKVKDFSIVGDINSDNQVSAMDLLLIKRHILGMGIDLFDIPQSDINEDSAVNLLDLLELKKYIIE